jgi:hypothetical protein
VLISPYIRPGTVSTKFYNHYSWLRTMEDAFDVARHSPGLGGKGHLGYAAQPGLAPSARQWQRDARRRQRRSAMSRSGPQTAVLPA